MLIEVSSRVDDVEIVIWGNIYFEDVSYDRNKAKEIIYQLYNNYGYSFTDKISGCYCILILDGCNAYAVKSEFGAPDDVYYVLDKEKIIFSNKLHEIISGFESVEKSNEDIQEMFLRYGFVPGKYTLIKNVFKVPYGYTYEFELGQDEVVEHKNNINGGAHCTRSSAQDGYLIALRDTIKNRVRYDSINATTLSGGYDSNILLHFFDEVYKDKIYAFTVGGIIGRNECKKTETIVQAYSNVSLIEGIVGPHTLEKFEEIIWRLEGSVYERGIFLQYELGKIVSENGIKNMIAGEGADQIMSLNYLNPFDPEEEYIWINCPKTVLQYIVIEKNIKMLNSFGVKMHYPFTNPDVVSNLMQLKDLNGIHKDFHSKKVEEYVDEKVAEQLKKAGGATSLATLFDNDYSWIEDDDVKKEVKCCETLNDDTRLEKILNSYLKKSYLEVFYRIYLDKERIKYYCDLIEM